MIVEESNSRRIEMWNWLGIFGHATVEKNIFLYVKYRLKSIEIVAFC